MRNYIFFQCLLLVISFYSLGKSQCIGDTHDTHLESSWLSCNVAPNPNSLLPDNHWIIIDLGKEYLIDGITIWNYNVVGSTSNGFNNFQVDYAMTENSWILLFSSSIPESFGSAQENGVVFNGFSPTYCRYLLLSGLSNHGGTCFGLSEIAIDIADDVLCEDFFLSADVYSPSCPGSANGKIKIDGNNGSPPYNYNWAHGPTTDSLDQLTAGSYAVSVSDINGCERGFLINLEDPALEPGAYHLIPIPTDHYYESGNISSSGLVAYNGDVDYSTETSVELTENFEIVAGGTFTASIEDCTNVSAANYTYLESDTNKYHVEYLGKGHILGMSVTASDEDGKSAAFNVIGGSGMSVDSLGASRFLAQTTLGANFAMIDQCQSFGLSGWLAWQFDLPAQDFDSTFQSVLDSVYIDPGNGMISFAYFRMAWWQNMLTGNDYLRDRVAFHLSQLFVVSDKSDLANLGEGLSTYYDMLHDNAFGNFRDILFDVTMQPSMGIYLSHVNNPKSDTSLNQFPDENYAREVMQLFSIGLLELENNGTAKRDIYGNEIATYSNNEVIEFSKIFTGLGFDHPMAEFGSRRFYDLTKPMIMYEEWHEEGPKKLLNNDTIPSGQTGMEDINDAVDNLFYHPNVGPFFCRRMIQYLVTSNPSPEYIARVVSIFENNGFGIRGDMKSIVRAILLDPEARSCNYLSDPNVGKLVEPMLRYTQFLRALDVSSSDNTFYSTGTLFQELTFQAPLGSPSVFNFFSPNYVPPGLPQGTVLRGPEFQILNSYTALGNFNLVNMVKDNNQVLQHETATIQLDLSELLSLTNTPTLLVDRLDLLFTYGNLTDGTKSILISAMDQLTTEDDKLKIALYLFLTSPEYVIGL